MTRANPGPDSPAPAGILLVDKPAGWTSHDVVARARRLTRQRRIGHTGTLDPMATGLLVLCLGPATRLVEYMTGHDKRYEGVVTLGEATDTDDAEGAVTATLPVPPIGPGRLRELEAAFTGQLQQRPPAYSAVKTGGQRAYAVARRGGDVDLPPRPVTVYALHLELMDDTHLAMRVHCGPGTYIRSLARDIGAVLGCGAHLSALRRTSVGGFAAEDAITLDQLERVTAAGILDEWLLPADEGLLDTDAAILAPAHAHFLAVGQTVETGAPGRSLLRVYDTAGEFLATGAVDGAGVLKPLKVFRAG